MSDATLLRPHAELDWSEDGPLARAAGDVYFSKQNGLEETRAVFLSGCGLPDGFQDRPVYTIGELGFGTGLNFLAAWELFRRTAPAGARLHFVSVEGFPLRREDARRALGAFPELMALSGALIDAWPAARKGAHRRVFDGGRVMLTLFQDEVLPALANMEMTADAWFLDGFAPARNADMWADQVFAAIARLSRPGTRLATFTVAGIVRRGLAGAGFSVAKAAGFGRKRERLEAVFQGEAAKPAPSPFARLDPQTGPVAVIGGGIAAASLIHALRHRGASLEVFAQSGLAAGASGAPSGLFTPRLEAADRPHVRATLAAFDHARALYAGLPGFEAEGALRLGGADKDTGRMQRLAGMLGEDFAFVDAARAEALTGLAGAGQGLWMEGAGRFDPAAIVRGLFADQPVRTEPVAALRAAGTGWQLLGEDTNLLCEAQTVILACGAGLSRFEGLTGLNVEHTAGRVAVFASDRDLPRAPVAWGSYVSRTPSGDVLVGATHEKGADPGPAGAAVEELRRSLAERLPDFEAAIGGVMESWPGVRAAFADRLPAAGGVAGDRFDTIWRDAARGGLLDPAARSGLRPGLAVLGGFGARGFAHAPLLAEALVSDLFGEPSPLERDGRQALHPARFAFRALRRS